jgi:hypothetical protein
MAFVRLDTLLPNVAAAGWPLATAVALLAAVAASVLCWVLVSKDRTERLATLIEAARRTDRRPRK